MEACPKSTVSGSRAMTPQPASMEMFAASMASTGWGSDEHSLLSNSTLDHVHQALSSTLQTFARYSSSIASSRTYRTYYRSSTTFNIFNQLQICSSCTARLSPPRAASPQVTFDPSQRIAANAAREAGSAAYYSLADPA